MFVLFIAMWYLKKREWESGTGGVCSKARNTVTVHAVPRALYDRFFEFLSWLVYEELRKCVC